MLSCNGCKNRNTWRCYGCAGWNKYASDTLTNPALAMDIDKEMKMLAKVDLNSLKVDLNSLFGVKSVERKTDMKIKKVYFNDPVTVVLWEDGTKSIVRTCAGDIYDPEKGLAMAIAKKALGNQGNYYEVFKKWLPEEKDEEELSPLDELKQALANLTIPKITIGAGKNDTDERKDTRLTSEESEIQWLSVREVAEANGLSVECVRKQNKDGFIPLAEKVDGKWKIPCYVFDDHVEVKCM